MSGKPTDPPPWEHPIAGDPPAFKKLDKAEAEKLALIAIAEAQQFVGGPANNLATDQQRFLADAERRRVHHEANVAVTEGKIRSDHQEALTAALIDLGRFEEAGTEYAREVEEACLLDDSFDCGCEREQVTLVQGQREVAGELDRHVAVKMQFNPYREAVEKLYECKHCKTKNVMAEPPARQAQNEMLRKQIEADTRHAIATGTPPMLPVHDANFLKTE